MLSSTATPATAPAGPAGEAVPTPGAAARRCLGPAGPVISPLSLRQHTVGRSPRKGLCRRLLRNVRDAVARSLISPRKSLPHRPIGLRVNRPP